MYFHRTHQQAYYHVFRWCQSVDYGCRFSFCWCHVYVSYIYYTRLTKSSTLIHHVRLSPHLTFDLSLAPVKPSFTTENLRGRFPGEWSILTFILHLQGFMGCLSFLSPNQWHQTLKISPIWDWRSTPTYCQFQSHVTQKLG